ncbi:MAG: hypothetical protein WAN43_03105 [Rhodomicrobium sp.]|jgi:hypothetical protein
MGRHRKLKEAALACGIALSLAQQINSAAAFSTEPVAPPSANLQANPAPQLGQPGAPQLDLNDPLAVVKPSGTDVIIPGFGTVATLPKLDFGLELLYGPKNGPDALQLDQHAPDGDMQIKGTLSHKF